MIVRQIVMFALALVFGGATAAGVTALMTKLGVVPRLIARAGTARNVIPCEIMIIVGTVVGGMMSVFYEKQELLMMTELHWYQRIFLFLVALGAGIYVGCQAMALAEVLNVFPILFRRLKLQIGLPAVVMMVAIGKMVGSLWYFVYGFGG